jgi:hypothetical protein
VEGRDILAELTPRFEAAWPDDGARAVRMPLALRVFRR